MKTSRKGARQTAMHSIQPVLQQQQQQPPRFPPSPTSIDRPEGVQVEIKLCVPADQERHLPRRSRAPQFLPATAPLPRQGEVIYLSSTSAWGVELVIHEWLSPRDLHVEVWITHVDSARHRRPTGFSLTQ